MKVGISIHLVIRKKTSTYMHKTTVLKAVSLKMKILSIHFLSK